MPAETDEDEVKWNVTFSDETTFDYENIITLKNNQSLKVPTIIAAASNNLSVLVIDSLLAVVSEQEICCTDFKKTIDDVAVLEGGFIAIADQNGTVSLGIVTDKIQIKQSCKIIAEKSFSQENAFLKIEFQIINEKDGINKARLICLSSSGRIFVFNDIILMDKDLNLTMVKMEKLESVHLQAHDFAINVHSIITVGSGFDCMAVYSSDGSKFDLSQTASLENDSELTKIQTSTSANIYLTLESKGLLFIWDALTLCIIYTWSLPDVLDFRIIELETEQNFRLENLKLITKERNNKICSYNMLTQSAVKELWLENSLTFFSKWPMSNDEIYLAIYCLDEVCEKQAVVYLRNYAETSPEKRLKYLVSKRRFDEAEKYAKQHGLNFVLDSSHMIQRLMEPKETFEETHQHIARCKAQLLKNQSRDAVTMQVISLIATMERRLEAYVRIHGEKHFCPEVWEIYRDEDPLPLFDELLMEETEKAFIFWECFQDELIQELKPGMIKIILENIPSHVPYSLIKDWLCQMVIPFIITKDPSSVAAIVKWVEIQVIALEATNKKTWPIDAINFCQFVLTKLELAAHCDIDQFDLNKLLSAKSMFSCASAMSPLRDLIKLLGWLNDLWTKYNYQITLQALIKETKESVVFRMLDRVMMVDLLPVVLQDQVLPYIRNNDLVADKLFADYVQDLLERSAGGSIHYIVTEKIKSFIRLIVSPKEKITAMLKLLKSVNFPLPEFVQELTEEILSNCQHFLVSELAETWKQAESNNTIFSYGIHPTAVKSTYDVKQVARYIIAKGGPFSHVEKILLANNISEAAKIELHCFHCQLLVDRNELDSLSKQIRSLPMEVAKKCCQHIIALAGSYMHTHDHPNVEIAQSIRMQYYEAADIASNILINLADNDVMEKCEIERQAQAIKNIQKLEVQYNVLINLDILEDKTKCLKIFTEQMQNINPSRIFRLARLLNIKEGQVLRELLCKAAVPDHLQTVKAILGKLSNNVPENVSMSAEFSQCFLKLIARENFCWPTLCLQICQLCLTHFSQNCDKIKDLCCLSSVMVEVFKLNKKLYKQQDELWPEEYWTDSESSVCSEAVVSDMLQILDDLDENNEHKIQEKVYVLTDNLDKHSQPQIAMQILTRIISSITASVCLAKDQNMNTFLTKEVWDLAKIIVGQLMERRRIDTQLSLACILMLPKNHAISLLTSYIEACGKNFSKMKRVAILAIAAAEVYQDSMLIDKCHSTQLAAKWGFRLNKIGIQFSFGQNSLLSASLDALKNLVQSPHCEPDILLEYCSDMKLESFLLDDQLIKMFEICLLKNMHTGCIRQRLKKAKSILSLIKNNTVKMLKNILPKISSYNYEALEFVLTEILALESDVEASQGLNLIRYLKYYTRCTAPSEIEIRHYRKEVECEDLTGVLPQISSTRLPFHLLMSNNRGKIITSEMKPHTLTCWLNMAPVLNLKKDTVIGNAVANVMESYLQSSPANQSTPRVSSEFFAVASQVESILERVEDRQYPVFCCDSLVGRLRHVGEITLTLKVSISYAEKWLISACDKEEEKKARKFMDSLTKKLKTSSSQWALQKIGLHHDAELNALIRQPKELIQKLYLHPAVLENHDDQKDINSACDEIASIHGLNVLEIRQSLLDKWLLGASSSADDLDQTMTFGNACNVSSEKEDLERVLYLLSSKDRISCLKYMADYFHLLGVHPQAEKRILYCILKCGADKETDLFNQLLDSDTQKIDS